MNFGCKMLAVSVPVLSKTTASQRHICSREPMLFLSSSGMDSPWYPRTRVSENCRVWAIKPLKSRK